MLFFDAFDEMADRCAGTSRKANFQELRRAAEGSGKVVLTCRTHYFKDRTEQIGSSARPSLTAAETALYKELRQQSNAEVVYLQEFTMIRSWTTSARRGRQSARVDWQKILRIHNLRDLASARCSWR